jgi:hypothetical protein
MRNDGRDILDEAECIALFQRLFPLGFSGDDVRVNLPGVDLEADFGERVGLALWDVFSENHDVVGPDGRVADLGSWRGSAGFIAERLNEQTGSPRYDYMSFYMGSLGWGRTEEGNQSLVALYEMIFRRLRTEGFDWEYVFPRMYLIDLSPLKEQIDRQEGTEFSGYDPSVMIAKQLKADRDAEERARLQEDLDAGHRQAVEKARHGPPPATVEAYSRVFGRFPRGWPPSA